MFLEPSQLFSVHGAEYPIQDQDHWRVDWSHISPDGDPLHPWHYDFYGKNLTYDSSGMLTGGKIDSIQFWEGPPPELNLGGEVLKVQITDLNLPVHKLLEYAQSGDDEGLREYIFHGNDVITGSAKSDILNGYGGNDVLTGGGGPDTFVFDPRWGKDHVTDFQVNDPLHGIAHDTIEFTGGVFSSFNDVMAHTTDVHGSAVIDYHGQTVTLDGVSKADLLHHPEYFLLA